jgi:hypothetical protein
MFLLLLVTALAATTAARDEVDLEPVPQLTSISELPETIVIGESFDLTVTAVNDGGLADEGYISVSFPGLTSVDDTAAVAFLPGSSSSGPVYSEYPAGTSLRHKDTSFIEATYLVSQFDELPWNENETNSLALRITPGSTGDFVVQVRVFMQAKQFWNDPESGPTDQQGWSVITRSVSVVAPPAISVSPTSFDFGRVATGASATQTFQLQNTGGGSLTGTIAVSSGGTDYSVTSGGGSFSLSGGATQSVTVQFSPSSLGAKQGTLRFTHDGTNTASPLDVALQGEGAPPPVFSLTPTSFDFGAVNVGSDSLAIFTIQNTGGLTLVGEATIPDGTGGFSVRSGGGGYSLESGQTRQVEVRFAPSTEGSKQSTFRVTHNASNTPSPVEASLTGEGIPRARIFIDPTSFDFGSVRVGTDSATTFIVTNQGGQVLEGEVSITGGGGAYSITAGAGSLSIAPGDSSEIDVQFAPTAAGEINAILRIDHNGRNRDTPLQTSLAGTGFVTPTIAVTPASIDFGILSTDGDSLITLSIENVGGGTLTGEIALVDAPLFYTIESGGGAYSLDADATREVVVRFAPDAVGTWDAVLRVSHNDPDQESPIDVEITGIGSDGAAILVRPDSLSFGEVRLGSDSVRSITIRNAGDQMLTGNVTLRSGAPAFQLTEGEGGFSLAPGDTTLAQVRFVPAASMAFDGALEIDHDGTNATSPITVNLTGTGLVVEMSISLMTDTLDFDQVAPGDSTASFQLANAGPDTLTAFISIVNLEPEAIAKGLAADSAFSLLTGEGPTKLGPDEAAEITVVFHPPATGSYAAVISISHNATNLESPTQIQVRGTKASGVASEPESIPSDFDLLQNYPNPVADRTTITFVLDKTEFVRLALYDVLGRQVAQLTEGTRGTGEHSVVVTTTEFPSGQYVYRLEAGNRVMSRMLTVSRQD